MQAAARRSVRVRSPVPVSWMLYEGCCAPPCVFSVRARVSLKAKWYASLSETCPSRVESAAPRSPEIRKWVKKEPLMRSDSWAASSAELEEM